MAEFPFTMPLLLFLTTRKPAKAAFILISGTKPNKLRMPIPAAMPGVILLHDPDDEN